MRWAFVAIFAACGTRTPLDGVLLPEAGLDVPEAASDAAPFQACHDWSVPLAAPCANSSSATILYENSSDAAQMGPIVIDDANIYWIESGGSNNPVVLRSMSKCGGNSTVLTTIGGYGGPYALVLRKGYLWWIGSTHMQRMPATGGPVESFGKPPQSWFRAFDVDDDHVFADLPSGSGDDLIAYSFADDTTVTLAPSIGDQVRVDCANAYFTIGGDYTMQLARVPKQGGTVAVLPSTSPSTNGLALPGAIAMDDAALYWVTQNGHELLRVTKDGTSTIAIAAKAATIAIAIDDTRAYYAASQPSASSSFPIMQAPKLGGDASKIATFSLPMTGLAVDQRSLYWSEDGSMNGMGIRITKIDK